MWRLSISKCRNVTRQLPLPRIWDTLDQVLDCNIFSTIDLNKAYHQISIHSSDIPKITVFTPFGLIEYRKMPFGHRNAAETIQRYKDSRFRLHTPYSRRDHELLSLNRIRDPRYTYLLFVYLYTFIFWGSLFQNSNVALVLFNLSSCTIHHTPFPIDIFKKT